MSAEPRGRFALKDEQGRTYGGWLVLARAANADGNAMWRCRCICCGELRTIAGIKLRSYPPLCACQRRRAAP